MFLGYSNILNLFERFQYLYCLIGPLVLWCDEAESYWPDPSKIGKLILIPRRFSSMFTGPLSLRKPRTRKARSSQRG